MSAKPLGLGAVLLLAVAAGLMLPLSFTGALIYSQSSNETTAINEGTALKTGTTTADFTNTQLYDNSNESITESGTPKRFRWNYDFGTNYNVKQPAEIYVKIARITSVNTSTIREMVNISIWNKATNTWDFINQTIGGVNENITTLLSWQNRDLSNYINSSGNMSILLEDDNTAGSSATTFRIDYLAINATFSPLTNEMVAVSNSSGVTYFSQANYTRYNYTRADVLWVGALWNASNVTNGTLRLNVSTNTAQYNYTEWYVQNISSTAASVGNWTYAFLNLSNATMFPAGGNVTVTFTANDSYYQTNGSHIAMYFGLSSNASVTAISVNETGNVVAGTPVRVYCRVADTYSNMPVAGYNVSFYNNSNLFGWGLTNSTGWASGIYNGTAGAGANYYLNCTIGNATGLWYYNSSAWNQSTLMTVVTDNLQPNITALWLDSAGVNDTWRTNLYMNASIMVNASDSTTRVQSAAGNVTYPDGKTLAISLHAYGAGGWRYVFADNETNAGGNFALNQTGNYTINVTMTDLGGNKNISWNLTFNVTSNYSVVLDGYTSGIVYNRGENLTFVVLDTNGVFVANSNVTANLTYPTYPAVLMSNWSTGVNSTLTLALNSSFNVTNYTMKILVNKSMGGNNTAYGEFRFNVSDSLQVNFNIYPSNSYTPTLSESLGTAGRIRVYVNTSRGTRFPYNVGWVNITCYGGSTHNLTKAAEDWYTNTTMNCYAPNAYSMSFTLSATANDTATGTTGYGTVTLTTVSAGGGGDGGGGGGGGTVTQKCDCEWTGELCGVGGCGPLEVFQTYNCTPAGCSNATATTRCQPSPAFCELNRRGFNFTISRDYVEVKRGENATLTGSITNTGNLTLEISIAVRNGCCSSFAPGNLTVQPLSPSYDFPITVHPALSDALGDYLFTVNATAYGLEATKSFTVRVAENPLLADIEQYKQQLGRLRGEISNYSASGIDVTSMESLASQLENTISNAGASIDSDNLAGLQAQVAAAKAHLEQAQAGLASLWLLKFALDNRYWIILGVVLAFIALYLLTQIAVPYMRLTREIRRMIDKEKSQVEGRKATYRDYFTGKVDEKAFEELIIGKQSEILSTKGALRHKMDERGAIVRTKLSAKAVKDWVKSGFGLRPLAARVAARVRKRMGSRKGVAVPN